MSEEPTAGRIPLATGSDGRAYISSDDAVQLLRAIAASCRQFAGDPDCDLRTAAAAIDLNADALTVRAISHTGRTA